MRQSYTTGQVAQLCAVTKRTVIKWIESGKLSGYRIPGSTHRRVAASELKEFMRRHRIPDPQGFLPKPRVLIVDDDPDFAELLRDALHEQYEIEVASTALEGASRIAAFRPDAVLVDMRLPDVNGLELCRQMQSATTAPMLAMSAYGHEVDLAEVRRSGAVDFLAKPVRVGELKKRLGAMVG